MTDRIDAALMGNSGRAYFFKGSEFVRWAVAPDKALGPPEQIGPSWPGLWPDGFDAAINWRNGKAYFFKGPDYIRYDLGADAAEEGWPKRISDEWPGLWPDGIDAALMGNSGRAYFFRGPEVIRWDVKKDAALGPAETIAANWPGIWPDGIDAAINWGNGKAYFFKGPDYIRYDMKADQSEAGWPKVIAEQWPGLWTGMDSPVPGPSPTSPVPGPSPTSPGGTSPVGTDTEVVEGCLVTPLIRGTSYFPHVEKSMKEVANDGFILIAAWHLEPNFAFGAGERMIDLLKRRARDGVDVRVLGWAISPNVTNSTALAVLRKMGKAGGIDGPLKEADFTIQVIRELRAEPAIGYRACLNTLAHPAGSSHMKFVMVGDEARTRVYTGGLDVHGWGVGAGWYDIQLVAEGSIANDCYRAYKQLWNEQVGRPVETVQGKTETESSHDTTSPVLPDRVFPITPLGTRKVRSLRTLPLMRFLGGPFGMPSASPLSFASNGATDVADALQPMLDGATQYAYLEDQYFCSQDVMSWLNAALKKNEALRVILVTGKPDPNDPRKPFEQARTRAVNDFLIDGLGPDPNQRIALLRHLHHIVHAKAAFVDDRVAIVGSANWAQRGLYTDIEHSLRFEDPVHGLAGDRQTIWGHHLGSSPSAIAAAVNDWFAIPFGAGHPTFERLRLPLPPAPMSATDEWEIDVVYDANSRHHWPTSPLPLPSVPGVPPAPPVP